MAESPNLDEIFTLGDDKGKGKDKPAPKSERLTALTLPQIEKQLTALIAMPGVFLKARGDDVCGDALINGAANEAKALVNLAKQKPQVRKALEALCSAGTYGELMMSTAAIVIPIWKHHGGNVNLPFLGGHDHDDEIPHGSEDEVVIVDGPPSTADFVTPEDEAIANGTKVTAPGTAAWTN